MPIKSFTSGNHIDSWFMLLSASKNTEGLIDLSNVSQDDLTSVLYNRIISIDGLKYRGEYYFTLKQLQNAGLTASTYPIAKSKDAVASLTNKATGQVTIFTSVQDAVDAAELNPSIVTLLKDVTLVDDSETVKNEGTVSIGRNQNIILDLNKKKLTSSSVSTIINNAGSTLTIEGEGILENSSNSNIAINNIGNLNVYDTTIISSNCRSAIENNGNGNINIKSAKIESYGINGIRNMSEGNVLVSDTSIIVKSKGYLNGIANEKNGNIIVKGCKIEVSDSTDSSTGASARGIWTIDGNVKVFSTNIIATSQKTLAIGLLSQFMSDYTKNIDITDTNIEVTSENNNSYGIYFMGSTQVPSTLNIYGNTSIFVNTNSDKEAYGIYNINTTGDIKMNEGEIKASSIGGNAYGISNQCSNNIIISGGTITGSSSSLNKIGNGIHIIKGTLKIWDGKDSLNTNINTKSPTINGSTYGVNSANGINFEWYDGKILGKTSILGTIPTLPDNCTISSTTKNSIQTSVISIAN